MQSEKEKALSGGRRKSRPKLSGWAVLLIALAVVLSTGGVLAKYVSSNQKRAEMESAQFHISSNYLEEGKPEYTVADWGNGFDILLYNYEKENIAQISGLEITYKITATNAAVSVKDQSGVPLSPNAEGGYTFSAGSAAGYHVLHVTPNENVKKGDKITVTVETTAPYAKTLSAAFNIQNNTQPEFTAKDMGGTVLVTVKTNDYDGDVKINWSKEKFSPDNTNMLMAAWIDTDEFEILSVERNSTYELLFFKKTDATFTNKTGSGTEFSLE